MIALASLMHEGNERGPAASPARWSATTLRGVLGPAWGAPCDEPRAARGLGALLKTVASWRHRSRTRHELEQLDDRLLRDIGLDPLEARFEARKPFWRA